jgi:organic radical activating enzyme
MTNNIEKKTWCVDPFIQMAHTADGFYRVCCIGEVHRDSKFKTTEMTPIEFFNTPEMQQVRTDMLKGDPAEFSEFTKHACSQCISNHHSGITSRRVQEFKFYGNNELVESNIEKHLSGETFEYSDLLYVNFKVLGNICNLKCIMCGSSASSKIAAEEKRYFSNNPNKEVELNPFTDDNKDEYFDEIDKIISNVQKFNLVGGENLIHPNFIELFERFIENPNAPNLNLTIITNGTRVPEIVLENAHRFKHLSMVCSIDGVYERGSYVRSGLNWGKFDQHMRIYKDHPHITNSFVVATQMLNIGYLDDIYDYLYRDLGIAPKFISWNNLVTNPRKWRAINLPSEIKQQYLEKLGEHVIVKEGLNNIDRMIKILESPQDSVSDFEEGMHTLKKYDKVRNTNLLEHFPEFAEYYDQTPEPWIKK